jgi:hypothetical protein
MNEQNGSHAEQPAQQAQRRHALSETERRHVADVRAQLDAVQNEVVKLKGVIYDREQELMRIRWHLSLYVGTVAVEAGLPMGAVLSPDGAALLVRD